MPDKPPPGPGSGYDLGWPLRRLACALIGHDDYLPPIPEGAAGGVFRPRLCMRCGRETKPIFWPPHIHMPPGVRPPRPDGYIEISEGGVKKTINPPPTGDRPPAPRSQTAPTRGTNMAFKFHRGEYLADLITGFKGVVTARTDSLTGCNQYFLQPPVDKEGKHVDGSWHDEHNLEYDHQHLGHKLSLDRDARQPPG